MGYKQKEPPLSIGEIVEIGIKLANQYEIEARDRVLNCKKYPENRYIFTKRVFRPIDGWDKEWYDVMYSWMKVLRCRGWKDRWADEMVGESLALNFQYMYDANPIDFGVEQYSCVVQCDSGGKVIDKRLNFGKLDPQYCSQIALEEE